MLRKLGQSLCQSTGETVDKSHDELSSTTHRKFDWPEFSKEAWTEALKTEPFFDLIPLEVSSEYIIDQLYPPDSLLCMSLDIASAVTREREHWRGKEASMEFIVANPMTDFFGLTQDGDLSHRCHGNATTKRTYQIIEFDQGTLEEQAAILSALNHPQSPLVLVVWSGSKSLHGWYSVSALSEEDKKSFFASACSLGADNSLWDQCKLVRMPGGLRSNGNRQSILFHTF